MLGGKQTRGGKKTEINLLRRRVKLSERITEVYKTGRENNLALVGKQHSYKENRIQEREEYMSGKQQ